jgi:hypothetical protein
LILRYWFERGDAEFALTRILKQGADNLEGLKPSEKGLVIQATRTLERLNKSPRKTNQKVYVDYDQHVLDMYTKERGKK